MKKKMTQSLSLSGLALCLCLGTSARQAQAQSHPATGSSKATQSRGSSTGNDENVKHGRAPNDPNTTVEAPPEKGGTKTRGSACRVHIDNRTPYVAEVYTDGNYRGEISAWGDLVGYVGCGDTIFYARAFFSNGSMTAWGPSVHYVDGAFTWSLTR